MKVKEMPKGTIVGRGCCPKCGCPIEIRRIENFPFPDDEQVRDIEICTICDFKYEISFTSTNATTSFDHSVLRDLAEQRIAKAIQEISNLISSYENFPTQGSRPNITDVMAALKTIRTDDFPLLYVKIAELKNSPLAEVRFDSLAEIMNAAESDRQFAELRGGHLDEGMAEWYENEARAASNDKPGEKVINAIVELVKLVEKRRKGDEGECQKT